MCVVGVFELLMIDVYVCVCVFVVIDIVIDVCGVM